MSLGSDFNLMLSWCLIVSFLIYFFPLVEDLVWHALKEKVEARMIELSPTSNTYYGTYRFIFMNSKLYHVSFLLLIFLCNDGKHQIQN